MTSEGAAAITECRQLKAPQPTSEASIPTRGVKNIMKLFCVSRISIGVTFLLFVAGSLKFSGVAAQNEPASAQESAQSLQVTANDEIAAEDVAGHNVHLHPLRSRAAARGRYEDPEIRQGNPQEDSSERVAGSASPSSALSTVPSVTSPGFYPADLSNTKHG